MNKAEIDLESRDVKGREVSRQLESMNKQKQNKVIVNGKVSACLIVKKIHKFHRFYFVHAFSFFYFLMQFKTNSPPFVCKWKLNTRRNGHAKGKSIYGETSSTSNLCMCNACLQEQQSLHLIFRFFSSPEAVKFIAQRFLFVKLVTGLF